MVALGLSCSRWAPYLQLAGSLVVACMWDLVPWPWIEHGPPALGVQSLIHCATREVPQPILKSLYRSLNWVVRYTVQMVSTTPYSLKASSFGQLPLSEQGRNRRGTGGRVYLARIGEQMRNLDCLSPAQRSASGHSPPIISFNRSPRLCGERCMEKRHAQVLVQPEILDIGDQSNAFQNCRFG